MVLGVIVAQVGDSGLPVEEELTLACAFVYSIKVHVNLLQSVLLDGVVGEAVAG